MLSARALDIVSGLESMSERTQMLTPGRRRRRERLIRPERHPPFAAVVAPYLLPVDIEGLLWLSGRRQHQRLAGSSRKRSRAVDERCRQQSLSPNQKMSPIEQVCPPAWPRRGSRFPFARRVQGIALKTEAVKPSPNASKLRL